MTGSTEEVDVNTFSEDRLEAEGVLEECERRGIGER
jgi:hypothetical protein